MALTCPLQLDLSGGRRIPLMSRVGDYEALVDTWLTALDIRDPGSAGHARRVAAMSLRMARKLGYGPADLHQLRLGALLHDVGKIGVPAHILHSPRRLSDDEFRLIQRHPGIGRQLLVPLAGLEAAFDVVYSHHEKWDGTGYPLGLAGDRIPWVARLVAVADVWDALCADRPYHASWCPAKACRHIQAQAGQHFDPNVVEVFMSLEPAI